MRTALALSLVFAAATARADHDHPDASSTVYASKEPFKDAERVFHDAKATLQKEYVDEVTDEQLYRGALAGMLAASGRKWDALLSPSQLEDMHTMLSGQFVGIGVEYDLDAERGFATVISALPGSPAEKAGLSPGDRIIKVEKLPVRGDGAYDAIRAIRGKVGTPVTLTIQRDDQIFKKAVTRGAVVWSAVNDLALPDGSALVWVRTFNEQTPALLRAALTRIAAQHPRGVIVDLRSDEGGLFDKMVECAGLLLPKGTLVVTELHRGKREEAVHTSGEPILRGVPVAVLVDGDTASGAEILAGALHDGLGARLVGARTHGKWNVQRVADLPNGWAMKFTVGLFKTPKGLSPDGKGLDPDVPVDLDMKTIERVQRLRDPAARLAGDPQLRAALAILK